MAEQSEQDKTLLKNITTTLKSLEEIRRPWEPMVDDIIDFVYHSRRKIDDTDTTKGNKTGIQVYDGTALSAANLLTDGLTGYTISKSFNWFGYSLPQTIQLDRDFAPNLSGRRLDSFPEVKKWLQESEEAMYSAFRASNLYDIAPMFVMEAVTIGTTTINIDEDVGKGRVVFSVPHFRECYCAENAFGNIDTNYRVYKLTLKQMVEKFGYKQMVEIDSDFKKDYKTNFNSTREIIHARYPRDDFNPSKMNGSNKPNASVWVMRSGGTVKGGTAGDEKLLLESGTSQPSFVTWRWRKNNDEWYGRSPAWDAFVEIMTANQMGRTNLEAGHKMVDPPMYGPDDLRGAVRRGPGGWTSVSDMNRVPRPLNEGIQLPFGLEMQDRIDAKLKDHFQVDFFLMLSQAALAKVEMTATQVIEMGGEKAAILGPRIGRMETESLSPIHDAVFAIEQKAGRIPEPPDILQEFGGDKVPVEYLGPLSQAQKKLFKSQGIVQGLDAIAGMAEMYPEVLDIPNPDATARDLLNSRGFPQKDINDEDEVIKIRKERREAAEQAQAFEQAITAAKAMPAAGSAIEPNSAADLMIEGAG